MASSHFLAMNSVVFEKMLFSVVQMEESKTNVVHMDDVLLADIDQLLKFYEFRLEHPRKFFSQLDAVRCVSIISLAHRFEFTAALTLLCDRLSKVIYVPTLAEIQFADRLNLKNVLVKWSSNCRSSSFFHAFVKGLVDSQLSLDTVDLFSSAHRDIFELMCVPHCMIVYDIALSLNALFKILFIYVCGGWSQLNR